MKSYLKFFASILLMLCLGVVCCAQTKIDWKQIKNIPDTLEFKNVLLEHLLFKSAYQPVMESIHQGAIYYDNQLERLRVYEHGQWRDLSVSIASDSIGAPLTILGYLQATDIYASQSAYIKGNIYASQSAYIKGNIYASGSAYLAGGVNASGTSTLNRLKVNTSLKVPLTTDSTLGAGSIAYDTATGKLKVLNSSNTWDNVGTDITVDSAMSFTSTNPVQNKVVNSYISRQLGSGSSDLYVGSVRTTYASATYADVNSGLTIPRLSPISESNYDGAIAFDEDDGKKLKYYRDLTWKTVATLDNTVSDVATGTANGTISVTKNGITTDVPVKGLGSAAYANVASFTPQSSSTPPSSPYAGQTYFDTDDDVLKYWNGTSWVSISEQKIDNLFTINTGYYSNSHGSASYTEVLWKPNAIGEQIVQYTGVVSTPSNSSTGRLSLWKLLDTTKPYVCVFTTATFGNTSDPSVCPSVSVAKTDSTGDNPITYFNFSIHDNDGGDTRVGTQYFFVQGFVAQ